MTAIRPIIAVGAALLLLGGCGGPDLTGTWVGTRKVDARPGADPIVVRQLSTIRLVVKPNGIAYLSDAGVPLEGRVLGSGKGGVFRTDSVAGVKIERQPESVKADYPDMELTLTGASELTLENPVRKERIVLRRESQPGSP